MISRLIVVRMLILPNIINFMDHLADVVLQINDQAASERDSVISRLIRTKIGRHYCRKTGQPARFDNAIILPRKLL